MNRLDFYIGKTVLMATLLAWLVVVAMDALFSFFGELGDVGRGDYGLNEAALYIALTLPGRAYQSFPMAVLIGSLLGLGGLAAQAELNAFRLAGCSPARLMRAVLQAGVLMLGFAIVIGEGWAPGSQLMARQMRTSALFDDVAMVDRSGVWVRDGSRFVQVGYSETDGSLASVTVFELDSSHRLASVTSALRATYSDRQWYLQDVKQTLFGDNRVDARASQQVSWSSLLDPGLVTLLARDAQSLSLPELGRYIAYLDANGSNVASYRLSYWQRWAAPVATLAMLYLSLGLVLGRLGRHSAGQRILVAVVIGLLFKVLNEIIAHAGLVYGMAPWLGAFMPSALVLLAGSLLLRRAQR